jgi:tetratricopeptide (TPR) repeat protein
VTWGAVTAAAVFAVHPLRVESVAWVTERRDVLSGFFFLLAVLGYLKAVERGERGRLDGRWRGISMGLFGAALLSKASTMMLPAVLLLLDVYPLGRRAQGLWALVREKVAYVALAALAGAIALVALRSGWEMTSYGDVGLPGRWALMTYSFSFYPWRWLWPVGLSPMYELPATVNVFEWRFLLPLAAVPSITAALYALRRRWPAGLTAWVYSALMVLPVSGAAHAGFQLAADRYSYLSGLGFAVLAGGAVVLAQEAADSGRLRRGLVAALMASAVVVVVLLGAGAWRQSRVWHDSETLWRWAVSVDPACALCHNNLGSALVVGAPSNPVAVAEAETHFRRAIALRPERDEYYNNLGGALALQGRLDEAAAAYREYLRRRPDGGSAAATLGGIYVRQGRVSEAIPLLRRALSVDARLEGARRDLALALERQADVVGGQGNGAEAERLRQEASELRGVGPAGKPPVEIRGRDREAGRP